MERLRQDLISQSRLIGSSKPRKPLHSKPAKIQRIDGFALSNRGGSDQEIPFELAKKIEEFFIQLAYLSQSSSFFIRSF